MELSIVLVIIGLIVGGILVGRELIHSAELRSQIKQFEALSQAANTFRLKYNVLPGDMTPTSATAFGFVTRAGTRGRGDGNDILESGSLGGFSQSGENLLFWNDLSVAGLIAGSFSGADCNNWGSSPAPACTGISDPTTTFPKSPLNDGMIVTIAYSQQNYFQLLKTTIVEGTSGNNNLSPNPGTGLPPCLTEAPAQIITPIDAQFIDSKIDDGMPLTGKALTINTENPSFSAAVATPDLMACGSTDPFGNASCTTSTNLYNISSTLSRNERKCTISVRFK